MSTYLSIYLSIYPSIYLSIYLSMPIYSPLNLPTLRLFGKGAHRGFSADRPSVGPRCPRHRRLDCREHRGLGGAPRGAGAAQRAERPGRGDHGGGLADHDEFRGLHVTWLIGKPLGSGDFLL